MSGAYDKETGDSDHNKVHHADGTHRPNCIYFPGNKGHFSWAHSTEDTLYVTIDLITVQRLAEAYCFFIAVSPDTSPSLAVACLYPQ